MMRSNRADYASPLEWLSLLRQDEVGSLSCISYRKHRLQM